ncbi:MAG: hypothetical protein M0Z31_10330 [Clostridia bacterium]|nr:hypothetical protein [Clostridia bacterium]
MKSKIIIEKVNLLSLWKTVLPILGFWGMVTGALGGTFFGGLFQKNVMFWQGLLFGLWVGFLVGLWLTLFAMTYNLIAPYFGGIILNLEQDQREQVNLEKTLILSREAGRS